VAGFLGGVDVGDEDAIGSQIEGLLNAGRSSYPPTRTRDFAPPLEMPLSMAESFS